MFSKPKWNAPKQNGMLFPYSYGNKATLAVDKDAISFFLSSPVVGGRLTVLGCCKCLTSHGISSVHGNLCITWTDGSEFKQDSFEFTILLVVER